MSVVRIRSVIASSAFLFGVAGITGTAGATRAEWEPDPVPRDAPPACIDPVGADGLAAVLARAPKQLGTYRLVNGKALDTPVLRIKAYGQFIPSRLGARDGEVQARFEASLLAEVKRDGENPENTEFTSAPGSLRIGPYRVTTRVVSAKARPLTYEAVVEEIGCEEGAVHPPLALGEQKTVWLSTEATSNYAFSLGPWWAQTPRMYVGLTSGLAPDVQQDDPANPHGWISFQGWEGDGGRPTSQQIYHRDLQPGHKLRLELHEIEILRVVYGKDTQTADSWRVYTKGQAPIASVLVRVTRISTRELETAKTLARWKAEEEAAKAAKQAEAAAKAKAKAEAAKKTKWRQPK